MTSTLLTKQKDHSRLASLLYERYLQIKRQGIVVQLCFHKQLSPYVAHLQSTINDSKKLSAMISFKVGLQLCDLQGNLLIRVNFNQIYVKTEENTVVEKCRIYIDKSCFSLRNYPESSYILVKNNATIGVLSSIYQQKIKQNVRFFNKLEQFIDGNKNKIDMDEKYVQEYQIQNDLNQDQNNAIKKVFQSHITFIKGPPGCGKTRTVSRIVRLLAQKGLKIIVGSVSNIANYSLIKEIIRQIQEHNYLYQHYHHQIPGIKHINLTINYSQVAEQKLSILYPQFIIYSLNYQVAKKILQINESPFYNENNIMEYIYKMKRHQTIQGTFYAIYMKAINQVVSKVDVMISTTISSVKINAKINSNNHFIPNVGILDEAAQASWGDGYIFLSLGIQRLVLVGDEKQLSPTVIGDAIENKILKQTMFENLSHLNQDYFIQLTTQYRMHPEIVQFPNHYIYKGRLKNGVKQQNFKSNIYYFKSFPTSFVQHNYQQTIQLVSTSSNSLSSNSDEFVKQYYNQYQASLIMEFLDIFPESELKNVGIITFYQMQNQVLVENLKHKIQLGLLIKTIDGYQGGEKDYIILSTVRCNSQAKIGFCAQQNRVNVALTRAKKGLIIFGNPFTLMEGKQFNEQQHNIWGKYYKFIYNKNKVLDIQTWRNYVQYTKNTISNRENQFRIRQEGHLINKTTQMMRINSNQQKQQ